MIEIFNDLNKNRKSVTMISSKQETIDQYKHFQSALMRDFQSELLNIDYIEPDRHIDIINTILNLSKEIRRLELNEN